MNDTTKSAPSQGEPEMKGWLFKWTNYLKGYQRRWFVLSNGLLSYYRNQAEMAHTCRGTISLHGALIHTVDSCTFVISNGGTQTFHIKAASEVERQSWVTALELAKARAIRAMESEDDEETNGGGESSREDISTVLRELNARLEELQTCSELLQKHGQALQRSLKELENLDDVQGRSKEINERATLFRIASNAMINRCSEYLEVAKTQGTKWHKMLQHEREQKLRLEEFVEQLARQHSHLEKAATQHAQQRPNNVGSEEEEEDNEFFDCVTDASNNSISGMERKGGSNHSLVQMGNSTTKKNEDGTFIMKIPVSGNIGHESEESSSETEDIDNKKVVLVSTTSSAMVTKQAESSGGADMESFTTHGGNVKKRRTRVPDKPNYPLSLWSIMKNCIGKDLSKIPMPVNFSEPLSMLQRLTEDFEYADVLDIAAKCDDPYEQLAYVAAFTVSAYSTTSNRTGKPFNPLLGETYEFDRTADLGWRIINEQVSHHPPMVAQYCEGKEWKCWQEFTMTSKFRGKYIQIAPLGNANVLFTATNRRYTWQKVTTTVHNIIVGKLWVDQYGDTDIIGYDGAAGIKCHLKYLPYSYFTRDSQRRVKGCVMDPAGEVKYVINGTWDNKIEISKVTGTTDNGANKEPIYQTGHTQTAWKRRLPAPDCDKYYNFTVLACQLNEPEDGVAPTDSRLRPDQRLMENGEWTRANEEKVRLEEKQRAKRREREQKAEIGVTQNGAAYESYTPLWFKKEEDPATGMISHVYQHEYWDCKLKQDWSRCPDIF